MQWDPNWTILKLEIFHTTDRVIRGIIGGGGVAGGGSGGTSAECLQVTFHRCLRHIVCLVYAREVLLVDLRIQHTVRLQFYAVANLLVQ